MCNVDETILLPTPPPPPSQPASYACHHETGIVEQFDVYLCPPTVAIHPERNSCTHYLDTASVLSGVMAVVVV